jgi:hypothetical protein
MDQLMDELQDEPMDSCLDRLMDNSAAEIRGSTATLRPQQTLAQAVLSKHKDQKSTVATEIHRVE